MSEPSASNSASDEDYELGARKVALEPLNVGQRLLLIKVIAVLAWFAWVLFALPLPEWSNMLNARYWDIASERAPLGLCTVSPELFKCTDGQNFVELAREAGRPGCSCGQGVLGEALCALMDGGISLSSLIGSTTGSGLFLFFSIVPTNMMWLYVAVLHYELDQTIGKLGMWPFALLFLALFQLFFTCITIFPACVWDSIHSMFAVLALICLGLHLLLVAGVSYMQFKMTPVVKVTLGLGIPAVLAYFIMSSGGSTYFAAHPSPWSARLYFYGEVIGLSAAFAVTPLCLVLGYFDDFLKSWMIP